MPTAGLPAKTTLPPALRYRSMAGSSLIKRACGSSTKSVPGTGNEADLTGTFSWRTACCRSPSSCARADVPLLEVSSEEAGPIIDRLGVP